MTDHLPVLRSTPLLSRHQREVDRARREIIARAEIAMLRDRAEIARITETGKVGMRSACDASAEEALLAPSDPLVQARVRVIADAIALSIAVVVKDAGVGL